jgi:hypothetical protein
MPFTLYFNSENNTEGLDISILEDIYKSGGKNKITKLILDSDYNQIIPKLPDNIKYVTIGYRFLQDIINIGDHIECLEFTVSVFNFKLASFPKNLKELIIKVDKIENIDLENIPSRVEKLLIQCSTFNQELTLDKINLKYLTINSLVFDKPLINLPQCLLELKLVSSVFDQPINNLPKGLDKLYISSKLFNQQLDNLPCNLKELTMQDMESFMIPLDNLPINIETLDLHFGYQTENKYTYDISNCINCKKLRIINYWGNLNLLPDSIENLDIWFPSNNSYNVRNYIGHWYKFPSNLKILDINREMARLNSIHDMSIIIKANIPCSGVCINGSIL